MSSKNIFLTALVVALAFSIVGYVYYIEMKKDDGDPMLFVPENSAIVLQFDEPGKVFGKLLADTTVWESLTQIESFKKLESDVLHLGAFLNKKPEYFALINNSPLIISFSPDKDYQTSHVLFLLKVGVTPFRSDIKSFLEENLNSNSVVEEYEDDRFSGFRIKNTTNDESFLFAFAEGVMIASSEKEMIVEALNTYDNPDAHFSLSKEFIQLRQSSGDKVDARIFFQYSRLGELLKSYANKNSFEALNWLNSFADWTETDLTIKNNEILLNGFTNSKKSGNEFLNNFSSQIPGEDKTINLLPFNTNLEIRQGFSDFQTYYNKYLKSKISKADRHYTNKISEFVGKEVSLASNASSEQEFDERTWAIIRLKSKKKAHEVLNSFGQKVIGKTSTFEGYTIRQINYSNLLSALFGQAFSVIKNNYYVFIGDFVVFGNSPESLIVLLNNYKTGKTLDLSKSYQLFSDNLSSSSNITLYINPIGIMNLLPKFLNDETAISFMENRKEISPFKGIVFQFARSQSGMFYTSFYANHGSASSPADNIAQWKISLSDEIVGQPYLVKDHNTNKYDVIVFDKSANMYLISNDGLILWKKRIDHLPISSINEVDFFKNGKIQYLFNTADFVYLIDKNGKMVKNYPKKLNPSATNGLRLFDYNRTKDYRLLVSLADKWTYNYNIRGTQVEGWKKPRMNKVIKEAVTRLVIDDKDYIIITDVDNNVKIVNRKGEVRIDLKAKPDKAKNSGYFENKTNNKGIILTTNQSGKLIYFNVDGSTKQTDFGDFSPEHFFLYEDFNNDGSLDFIFLDKNELKVFSRLKKEIFSYRFNTDIKIKPMFFMIGKNQKALGIVADQEKTIYLFDNKGNIIVNKGLIGETPFTVGSLNNNNETNLISASGNLLYNYRLN